MTDDKYMTMQEVIKESGKSESTVRRWLSEIKKTNRGAIKTGKNGNKTFILILKSVVNETFSLKNDNSGSEKSSSEVVQTVPITDDYKMMIKILNEQLKEKDKQITELLKTNTSQSSYIAGMKKELLLQSGQDLKEQENIRGDIENMPLKTEETKETIIHTSNIKEPLKDEIKVEEKKVKKTNKKGKKGFWRNLFGKSKK
jgi:hypothetical protein